MESRKSGSPITRAEFLKETKSIHKEINLVNGKVNTLDDKFNKLDDKFNKLDDKFNKLDDKFDKLDDKVNNIALALGDTNARLQKVEETMATKNDIREVLNAIDG